jgi:hypothetical protein
MLVNDDGGTDNLSGNGEVETVAAGDELSVMRDRVVALYRERSDVIPELIGGETLAEIEASLNTSQQAFARLHDRLGGTRISVGVIPPVAAGGGERRVVAGTMTAVQKIAAGLATRQTSRQ